jgi:hypothetical protein
MTSDMTESDAHAAIQGAKKVHFANRCQIEKASFEAVPNPGNWSFFTSRQQGAEIEKTSGFPDDLTRPDQSEAE